MHTASRLLEEFDKRTIQTVGIALIILGILLIVVSLLSIIAASMVTAYCPASGCPPYSLPAQSLLLPSFFVWPRSPRYRDRFAYHRPRHEIKARHRLGPSIKRRK